MRIVMFYHSLISDWNNGPAHFLRGLASELLSRGHDLAIYEPVNAWSVLNLIADHGVEAIAGFKRAYPDLRSNRYDLNTLDLPSVLKNADIVLVHEWNHPDLIAALGALRVTSSFRLFFHDTHRRCVSDPAAIEALQLQHYDGVLASGQVIRAIYLENGWTKRAWLWHEAVDARVFGPRPGLEPDVDLVWFGNWGDQQRAADLEEFLLEPVRQLRLNARVYGARYPQHALEVLAGAGIEYGGWLPNYRVPDALACARLAIHVPPRSYACVLPGIPTMRVLEPMACATPLVIASWVDTEHLFRPSDARFARTGAQMCGHIEHLLRNPGEARAQAEQARRTVRERHTCAQRVDRLLAICDELSLQPAEMNV